MALYEGPSLLTQGKGGKMHSEETSEKRRGERGQAGQEGDVGDEVDGDKKGEWGTRRD